MVVPSPSTLPAASGAPTTINFAYSQVAANMIPFWAAASAGYFTQRNLDVGFNLASGNAAVATLLSGETTASIVGTGAIVSANLGGTSLVITAAITPVHPHLLESAPDVTSAADLKGKTVAISQPGSSSDIATREALRALGLDPDTDVSYISAGGQAQREAALISGQVAAALIPPPDNLQLEAHGTHQLFDLTTLPNPTAEDGVVFDRSWIGAHHQATQDFVDATIEGLGRLETDRAFFNQIVADNLHYTDQQTQDETYRFYIQEVFPLYPYPRPEQLQETLTSLQATNPAAASFDPPSMIDASFVQGAEQRQVGNVGS